MAEILIEGDGQFPMDVRLPIVTFQIAKEGAAVITAQGDYRGHRSGVEIRIRGQMKPGLVDGDVDTDAFYDKGIIVRAADGTENLSAIFSEIYKTSVLEVDPLPELDLTCIALDGNPAFINTQHLNFKVFHDDQDELGLYFEMFLHVDVPAGYVRFDEKDEEYRDNVVKAFGALR